MRLVLASASPRRQQLLRSIGLTFDVIPADLDESSIHAATPHKRVCAIAQAKARAVATSIYTASDCLASHHPCAPEMVVLAADTMVIIDGEQLGKPQNIEDARKMLHRLSGKTHEVVTAVTLINTALYASPLPTQLKSSDNAEQTHISTSLVTFKPLSDDDIDSYLHTASWQDKAGAYGIQEEAGGFVERLEGDFNNVMGLPLDWVQTALQRWGIYTEHVNTHPIAMNITTDNTMLRAAIYPRMGDSDTLGTPYGISLTRPPLLLLLPQHLNSQLITVHKDQSATEWIAHLIHQAHTHTHTTIALHVPATNLDGQPLNNQQIGRMVVEVLDRLGVPEVRLIHNNTHQQLAQLCLSTRHFRYSSTVGVDMQELIDQYPSTHQGIDLLSIKQLCTTDQPEYTVIPTAFTPHPSLNVRPLTIDDADDVQRLYHRLLMYLEDHTNYCGWKLGSYPTTDQIDRALQAKTLYGAYRLSDNALVGAASFACDTPDYYDACGWTRYPVDQTMMVHMLMADPQVRRLGIARSLLWAGRQLAQERHCQELRLNTSVQNVLSCRLYEQLGFIRCYPLMVPYPDLDLADWTCVYTMPLTQ